TAKTAAQTLIFDTVQEQQPAHQAGEGYHGCGGSTSLTSSAPDTTQRQHDVHGTDRMNPHGCTCAYQGQQELFDPASVVLGFPFRGTGTCPSARRLQVPPPAIYFRRLALRTLGKAIALPAASGKGRVMLSMAVAGMMTTSCSVWRTIVGFLMNSLSRSSA